MTVPEVPDEIAILLALARTDPDESDVERAVKAAENRPDWERVLTQASRHRVLPLVARNMRRLGIWQKDEYLYANFDTAIGSYHYHGARNRALHAEYVHVVERLRRKLPRIALRKGMHLAHRVYGDAALRPMMDLDLLVAPVEAVEAVEALEELGYASGKPTPDLRRIDPLPREQQLYWRLYVVNLPTMFRLTSDPLLNVLVVDLTVGIFPSQELNGVATPALLDRAEEVDLGGGRALVLSPEDLVLDLCVHLHKESTMLRYVHRLKHQRLIQYCDLRESLRHHADEFDWDTFLDRCAEYRSEAPAHFALAHLEMLFPGTVPERVVDATRPAEEGFLDLFGGTELPEPLRWDQPFLTRMFSSAYALDAPRAPGKV